MPFVGSLVKTNDGFVSNCLAAVVVGATAFAFPRFLIEAFVQRNLLGHAQPRRLLFQSQARGATGVAAPLADPAIGAGVFFQRIFRLRGVHILSV